MNGNYKIASEINKSVDQLKWSRHLFLAHLNLEPTQKNLLEMEEECRQLIKNHEEANESALCDEADYQDPKSSLDIAMEQNHAEEIVFFDEAKQTVVCSLPKTAVEQKDVELTNLVDEEDHPVVEPSPKNTVEAAEAFVEDCVDDEVVEAAKTLMVLHKRCRRKQRKPHRYVIENKAPADASVRNPENGKPNARIPAKCTGERFSPYARPRIWYPEPWLKDLYDFYK